MDRTDPAYDEYLSTGIDPTGGELEEEPLYPARKYHTVWSFQFQGNIEELSAIFEKHLVPYSFSDCTLIQPHQFVVEETADSRSPIFEALNESGLDIQILGYEPTHRLVYQRAYESCYGDEVDA